MLFFCQQECLKNKVYHTFSAANGTKWYHCNKYNKYMHNQDSLVYTYAFMDSLFFSGMHKCHRPKKRFRVCTYPSVLAIKSCRKIRTFRTTYLPYFISPRNGAPVIGSTLINLFGLICFLQLFCSFINFFHFSLNFFLGWGGGGVSSSVPTSQQPHRH